MSPSSWHHHAVKNYGSIIYHDNSNYIDINKQQQRYSLDTEQQYDTCICRV